MEQNNISNKLTFPLSAPPKQPSQVEPKKAFLLILYKTATAFPPISLTSEPVFYHRQVI